MSVQPEDVVVGAEFLIVKDISSHAFKVGDVVRITEADAPGGMIRAEGHVPAFGRRAERWVATQDLDHVVTDAEVQMAIESIKRVQQ